MKVPTGAKLNVIPILNGEDSQCGNAGFGKHQTPKVESSNLGERSTLQSMQSVLDELERDEFKFRVTQSGVGQFSRCPNPIIPSKTCSSIYSTVLLIQSRRLGSF